MTTQRKPYVRPVTANWWKELAFYRFYMLREGTAILAVWFSSVLLYGVFALKGGAQEWMVFVHFLQHPLILLINFIALLAALLHSKTWFDLAPKAANIVINNAKMGPKPIITALWVLTAIITIIILALALL